MFPTFSGIPQRLWNWNELHAEILECSYNIFIVLSCVIVLHWQICANEDNHLVVSFLWRLLIDFVSLNIKILYLVEPKYWLSFPPIKLLLPRPTSVGKQSSLSLSCTTYILISKPKAWCYFAGKQDGWTFTSLFFIYR